MEGELPEARSGHSGLIYEKVDGTYCMLVYGGSNGFKVLDCVYQLAIKHQQPFVVEWIKMKVKPLKQGQPQRQFHSSIIYHNSMYVFGGGDGKQWLNSMLRLDLLTYEWSELTT